jgi:exodeoxyribonuclease V alpha subunit
MSNSSFPMESIARPSLLVLEPEDLRPIDRNVGKTFGKPPWNVDARMQHLLEVLSFRTSEAHSCIDLSQEEDVVKDRLLPENLSSHDLVSLAPRTDAPLVLDGERLYTQRLWKLEHTLAKDLVNHISRGNEGAPSEPRVGADDILRDVFPDSAEEQKQAILSMLRSHFHILQGGPGTGKTSCLASLIAIELKQNPHLRIRLAAPSGKAAARMKEAISSAFQEMPAHYIPDHFQLETYTLHRLLGARPSQEQFRHHRANPLDSDLLVVDEAGMIGLPMMKRLLEALPAHGRLLLLGDKDQLSSVETGSVFADLMEALPDSVAHLKINHRFQSDTRLGRFAQCVQSQDLEPLQQVLASSSFNSGQPCSSESQMKQGLDDSLLWFQHDQKGAWMEQLISAAHTLCSANSSTAWEALSSFRALSPVNKGPQGVLALNEAIEKSLRDSGALSRSEFPENRPVRVRKNSRGLKVYNGDVGLVSSDSKRVMVRFQGEGATTADRLIPISSLPDLETAWAITIHASQGDGYDNVFVNLPAGLSRSISRELLYTAVTRAKKRVFLLAEEDQICNAITTPSSRQSGLCSQIMREIKSIKTQQSS